MGAGAGATSRTGTKAGAARTTSAEGAPAPLRPPCTRWPPLAPVTGVYAQCAVARGDIGDPGGARGTVISGPRALASSDRESSESPLALPSQSDARRLATR